MLYPDNALRAGRVQELANETTTYFLEAGNYWSAFTGRLKDANAAVARSYRAIGATPPPVTRVQIEAAEGISEWVEWAIAIPSGIAIEELLLGRQFRNAIISRWSKSPGFKTWAEVKFRGKFTRGKILGGVLSSGIAFAATFGIQVAIEAIAESRRKEELLASIQDLLPIRADFWVAREQSKLMADTIDQVLLTVEMLEGLEISERELGERIQRSVANIGNRMQAITIDVAYARLAQSDHSRGSYLMGDFPVIDHPVRLQAIVNGTLATLDLWDSRHENEAAVKVDTRIHGGYNQKWVLEADDKTKSFRVRSVESGKYLTVFHASTEPGVNIVTYEGNEGDNQRWNFAAASGGLYLVSRSSGLVLTIADEANLIGSRVTQDTPDTRQGQRWLMVP